MSATLIAALVIQLVAVCLLRARLGRHWLGRPFTIFVLMAVVFHGISELLIHTPAARGYAHSPRWSIEQSYIDDAAFMVSAGLLTAVLTYVIFVRPIESGTPEIATIRSALQPLDWRITGLAAVPLLVATVHGRGYGSWRPDSGAPATVVMQLSNTFLVILVVLTAFSFVLNNGVRWLMPALAAQSLTLAVAGQRLELFVGAATLLVLLYQMEIRLSRRAVLLALSVATIASLGITSARESVGREYFRDDSGLLGRSIAIANGIVSPPDLSGLWSEVAFRFDANVFAGQIDRSVQSGAAPLGVSSILDSLLISVPSALYADKLQDSRARSLEHQLITELNVVPIDYAPGSIGPYLGTVGRRGLLVLMLLVGLGFALSENWLLRRVTLSRVLILASMLQGVLFFAKGLAGMAVFLRTGLFLVMFIGVLKLVYTTRPAWSRRLLAGTGSAVATTRRASDVSSC
jgi:hypothetical protein